MAATSICIGQPVSVGQLPEIAYSYKAVPTYGGGAIQHVAISPTNPDLILAGVDVAGIFRSEDSGTTWEPSWNGLKTDADFATADVLFDPIVPNRAWLAAGKTWLAGDKLGGRGGLFRSDNWGKTWECVNPSLHFVGQYGPGGRQYGDVLWRDPKNSERILIGTIDQGLLESTDGGQTVRAVIAPENIGSIGSMTIQPGQPDTIYVVARDFGDKFRPNCPTGLWQSDDSGKTFRQVIENCPLWCVAASQDGSVLASGKSIRYKKSSSQQWQEIDTGGAVHAARFIVAADPHHAGRYLVVTVGTAEHAFSHPKLFEFTSDRPELVAMYRDVKDIYTPVSTDPKDGWYTFSHWFAAGAGNIVFHPQKPGTVYMTDWYTVNHSTDGGRTWASHLDGLLTLVPTHAAYSIKYPGQVYLGFADVGLYEATIDGNRMQTRSARNQIPASHTRPFVFQVNDTEITLIDAYGYSGASSLYRREGNGSWKEVLRNPQEKPWVVASDVVCDTASQTLVHLTVTRDAYFSTDAGQTWKSYTPELPEIKGISFSAPWWIADTAKGTYRARNIREGWEHVASWPAQTGVDVKEKTRWFGISPRRGLVRSTDNADTFSPVLSGAQSWTQGSDGTLYAWSGTVSGGVYWIAVSQDGGDSWRRVTTPPGYPQGVSLTPDPHHPGQFLFGSHGICFWLATPESQGASR